MRIHNLHRRVIRDMDMMIESVNEVLPVKMPSKYASQKMNLGAFIKRLNTATEPFNVINEIEDDVTTTKGTTTSSALWYPTELLPVNGSEADIRILWHPHPDAHRIKITPAIWARRRYYFWERVAHELVHRYQDVDRPEGSARRFKVRTALNDADAEQKQYLGDYDELEAYAHDAALEFVSWWPEASVRDACKLACAVDLHPHVWSTYDHYMSTFEVGHPARTHFRRKVRQWHHAMLQSQEFYDKLSLPRLA